MPTKKNPTMDDAMNRDLDRSAKFVKVALDNGLDFVTGNCDFPVDMTGLKVSDLEEHPVVKKAFRTFLEGLIAMSEEMNDRLVKSRSRSW